MRSRARARRPAALLISLLAASAFWSAPAQAEVKTTNACYSSFETRDRDLDMTLSGIAAAPATAGGKVTLSATSVASALPDFMPVYGYNLGILQKGKNDISATVHVAIAGANTVEGVQVVQAELSATSTVTDPDGSPGTGDETATPLAVSVNLPDSTWTPSGSAAIQFSQAAPGHLPEVAGVGPGGAVGTPKGSIFVAARIGPAKLSFDCQPGTTDLNDISRFTAATAAAFATATKGSGSSGSGSGDGDGDDGDGDGSSGPPVVPIAIAAVVVLGGGAILLSRRRGQKD